MTTLLSPEDIAPFVPSSGLGNDDLQLLLDAADAEIIRYAGPIDAAVEWLDGGQQLIVLGRKADSITSVVEHNLWNTDFTTLDPTDYEIDPTGYILYRRLGGVNSRHHWWGRVVVTYAPAEEEAIRKGVEIDLVKLMMTYQPGASSETVGSWTTQLASNAKWNNDTEREAILSRLVVHGRMAVV